MKISDETLEDTRDYVSKRKPGRMQLLRRLTVELIGNVEDHAFFGTGVIMRIEAPKTVYIVTAKHNLHVAGGQRNGTALTEYFRQKVRVEVARNDEGTSVRSATLKSVAVVDGETRDRGYDVMIVKVEDTTLFSDIKTFLAPGATGRPRHFTSLAWQSGTSNLILDLLSLSDARKKLGAADWIDDEHKRCVLLQMGWGRGDTNNNVFGKRALRVVRLKNPTYIAETADHREDVFTFDTGKADTTREGDSGGPIFCIDERERHVWLVGVALGANFYEDHVDPEDNEDIENNAFTVISTDRLGDLL